MAAETTATSGTTDVRTKPVRVAELIGTLEELLGERKND